MSNAINATGIVLAPESLINVTANKYSFHPVRKLKIAVVARPGPIKGKISNTNTLNVLHPSIIPDSSISYGIWEMKPIIM